MALAKPYFEQVPLRSLLDLAKSGPRQRLLLFPLAASRPPRRLLESKGARARDELFRPVPSAQDLFRAAFGGSNASSV
jgi:hypothetical protein